MIKIQNISDNIVFGALKFIKHGQLKLINFNGTKYCFGESNNNLNVEVVINKPGFTFNIIKNGSSGLAESYIRGDFETNNLSDLIELTAKNIQIVHKFSGLLDFSFINSIKSIFIKNTIKQSKKNISKHYDLGNEFFSLWLDKTLTYSSAIFENNLNNLEEAQINKYKKLTHLLKPKNGDKILEIGCGWGGFAEYLGKNFDVKLDCITISKKQFEFAKDRIQKNHLNEKVNIQLMDYRDIKKKYNSIASIEMIRSFIGPAFIVFFYSAL